MSKVEANNTVQVFVKDGKCVQCDMTIKMLLKLGIHHTVTLLKDNLVAEFLGDGFRSAPIVITPDNTRWSGFKPEEIKKINIL